LVFVLYWMSPRLITHEHTKQSPMTPQSKSAGLQSWVIQSP